MARQGLTWEAFRCFPTRWVCCFKWETVGHVSGADQIPENYILLIMHVVGLVFSFIFLVNGCLDMFCSILLEPTGLGPWGLAVLLKAAGFTAKLWDRARSLNMLEDKSRQKLLAAAWIMSMVMECDGYITFMIIYYYIYILQSHGFRFLSLTQFICRIIHTFCVCVFVPSISQHGGVQVSLYSTWKLKSCRHSLR